MTSEPLTVEELERVTREIIAITRNYGTWTDAQYAKSSELIRKKLQSHSRQLWLEAAQLVSGFAERWHKEARAMVTPSYADRNLHYKYLKLDNEAAGMDECADQLEDLVKLLRTKAESTPKPSPEEL